MSRFGNVSAGRDALSDSLAHGELKIYLRIVESRCRMDPSTEAA